MCRWLSLVWSEAIHPNVNTEWSAPSQLDWLPCILHTYMVSRVVNMPTVSGQEAEALVTSAIDDAGHIPCIPMWPVPGQPQIVLLIIDGHTSLYMRSIMATYLLMVHTCVKDYMRTMCVPACTSLSVCSEEPHPSCGSPHADGLCDEHCRLFHEHAVSTRQVDRLVRIIHRHGIQWAIA